MHQSRTTECGENRQNNYLTAVKLRVKDKKVLGKCRLGILLYKESRSCQVKSVRSQVAMPASERWGDLPVEGTISSQLQCFRKSKNPLKPRWSKCCAFCRSPTAVVSRYKDIGGSKKGIMRKSTYIREYYTDDNYAIAPYHSFYKLGILNHNRYSNLSVHYSCLYYCAGPNMIQKEDECKSEEDNIHFFLISDIQEALKNFEKTKCCFCRKPGAMSQCANTRCIKWGWYHLPCGINHGTYQDDHCTYCPSCASKKVPNYAVTSSAVLETRKRKRRWSLVRRDIRKRSQKSGGGSSSPRDCSPELFSSQNSDCPPDISTGVNTEGTSKATTSKAVTAGTGQRISREGLTHGERRIFKLGKLLEPICVSKIKTELKDGSPCVGFSGSSYQIEIDNDLSENYLDANTKQQNPPTPECSNSANGEISTDSFFDVIVTRVKEEPDIASPGLPDTASRRLADNASSRPADNISPGRVSADGSYFIEFLNMRTKYEESAEQLRGSEEENRKLGSEIENLKARMKATDLENQKLKEEIEKLRNCSNESKAHVKDEQKSGEYMEDLDIKDNIQENNCQNSQQVRKPVIVGMTGSQLLKLANNPTTTSLQLSRATSNRLEFLKTSDNPTIQPLPTASHPSASHQTVPLPQAPVRFSPLPTIHNPSDNDPNYAIDSDEQDGPNQPLFKKLKRRKQLTRAEQINTPTDERRLYPSDNLAAGHLNHPAVVDSLLTEQLTTGSDCHNLPSSKITTTTASNSLPTEQLTTIGQESPAINSGQLVSAHTTAPNSYSRSQSPVATPVSSHSESQSSGFSQLSGPVSPPHLPDCSKPEFLDSDSVLVFPTREHIVTLQRVFPNSVTPRPNLFPHAHAVTPPPIPAVSSYSAVASQSLTPGAAVPSAMICPARQQRAGPDKQTAHTRLDVQPARSRPEMQPAYRGKKLSQQTPERQKTKGGVKTEQACGGKETLKTHAGFTPRKKHCGQKKQLIRSGQEKHEARGGISVQETSGGQESQQSHSRTPLQQTHSGLGTQQVRSAQEMKKRVGLIAPHSRGGLTVQPTRGGYSTQQICGGVSVKWTHSRQELRQTRGGLAVQPTRIGQETQQTRGEVTVQQTRGGLSVKQTCGGLTIQRTRGGMSKQPTRGGLTTQLTRHRFSVQQKRDEATVQQTLGGQESKQAQGGLTIQQTRRGARVQQSHGGLTLQQTRGGETIQQTHGGLTIQQTRGTVQQTHVGLTLQQTRGTVQPTNCGQDSPKKESSQGTVRETVASQAVSVGTNTPAKNRSRKRFPTTPDTSQVPITKFLIKQPKL